MPLSSLSRIDLTITDVGSGSIIFHHAIFLVDDEAKETTSLTYVYIITEARVHFANCAASTA